MKTAIHHRINAKAILAKANLAFNQKFLKVNVGEPRTDLDPAVVSKTKDLNNYLDSNLSHSTITHKGKDWFASITYPTVR